MNLRTRTELIQPLDVVQLTATFCDQNGNPVDTDSYPNITIIQPNGMVILGPTSLGMSQLSVGKYQFDYKIGFNGFGVYSDVWQAQINGFNVEATFNFVVNTTDQPALNTDGYYHLGDDVPFDYSQEEIFNINKLLKSFRRRLNSSGLIRSTDLYGNVVFKNCDIFTVDQLVSYLCSSLSHFNEIPHFTFFTFADSQFISEFLEVLVQGALIEALFAQALVEKGKLANISDNGVSLQLPDLGEMLNTQASTMMTAHTEKLKFIKNTFKPQPLGLAGYNLMGRNPTYRMLRMLRERQIV